MVTRAQQPETSLEAEYRAEGSQQATWAGDYSLIMWIDEPKSNRFRDGSQPEPGQKVG